MMNIASKFGYKNTGKKSSNKKSDHKPFRSSAKKIDWQKANFNESRALEYRLDRLQEIQHDIYQDTPEWSPEDKELIAFMWDNFKKDKFPLLGVHVWDQFVAVFQAGPNHPKVLNGEFRNMLMFIKQTLCAIMQQNG